MTVAAFRNDGMRSRNLAALLRLVHFDGPQSRAALTSAVGLTRATVGVLVGELVRRGLVVEEPGEAGGTPGRPSTVVRARPDQFVAVAAEIAVDSLTVAIVGVGGHVHARERVNRVRRRTSPGQVVPELAELIHRQLADLDATVIGCGVALHGVIRRADGFVHLASNLGWREVPLRDELSRALGDEFPVVVGNDGELGGLAEVMRGAGKAARNLLYISSEVGIGGGLIVDGQPYLGAGGYAAEIGHLMVNPDGIDCRCGSRGCWESEIGELALLRRAGREPGRQPRAALAALFRDAAEGEQAARLAVEETGRWFALGLASLVNVLNPDRVVVDGQLADLYPLVEDIVRETLQARCLEPSRSMVDVVPSALERDAALLGAAELALRPVLTDPSIITPRTEEVSAT